ncbi:OLC1v1031994C2 [Oldenlandia corymbosa var. corymbosa]|uniref:OLC1v1031994C2 n=1 Tax=Oldenlandia corymbosa var. corymbosa TaxID=529605 RepID=A0AAV1CKJ5_OLDCO|nr:OLC1v1031994C2 [Oldenlandia corymbosa var. corymbosa]
MGSSSEDEDSDDAINLNKKRRVCEDNEGDGSEGKKLKMLGNNYDEFKVLEKSGEKGDTGYEEEINSSSKKVSFCKGIDFDLNVTVIESGDDDDEPLPVDADRTIEVIDIPSSDESEDEKLKGDVVEEFDHIGLRLVEGDFGGKSSRKEKGQAKIVDDSWLSLTNESISPIEFELHGGNQEVIYQSNNPILENHYSIDLESSEEIPKESFQFELLPAQHWNANPIMRQAEQARYARGRASRLEWRERARRFAQAEFSVMASSSQEKASPVENDSQLGKRPGPFSDALKSIRERMLQKNKQLIEWKPSGKGCDLLRSPLPSLVDLSVKVLAENAEAIVSLELIPDSLRKKLANVLCNRRGMNIRTFELFVSGSPTEICIKDSSWLTQEQLIATFRNFDASNLTVLQLELCGQCTLDNHVIRESLLWSSNSLPKLQVLSLKGAARLSDDGLKAIVTLTPLLKSINLSKCSLLTHDAIDALADTLGSMLRELYIDGCQKMNPTLTTAFKEFSNLEVLSVAESPYVSDDFLDRVMTMYTENIKELDLAGCSALTDVSLRIIANACTSLRSLNISNLDILTNDGLQYLADGCRQLQMLKLCRSNFSDEAIAAYLEASGKSLQELSLNSVTSVGPCTAFSLAKCCTNLSQLDLSWCRKITTEALGVIVDSCSSLKLIKLFGCSQVFPP